jgi:hypothetical protein
MTSRPEKCWNVTPCVKALRAVAAYRMKVNEAVARSIAGIGVAIPLDAPAPPTLAEQIERTKGAMTAVHLAKILNVSKITIFKLAKARAHSIISHRDVCAV